MLPIIQLLFYLLYVVLIKQELRTTKNYNCNFEYSLHKLLHQAVTAAYNSMYIVIIHLVQFKVALIEA